MNDISRGTLAARELIADLKSLSARELSAHTQRMITQEVQRTLQTIWSTRTFEDLFNIPMTREDFDRIYHAMRAGGIAEPERLIQEEGDFYRELATNENTMGLEYIALIKSRRLGHPDVMKTLDRIAQATGLSQDELDRKLGEHIDFSRLPGPELTPTERDYIQARRAIVQCMTEHFYKNTPHSAPADSPWAQRILAGEAASKTIQTGK